MQHTPIPLDANGMLPKKLWGHNLKGYIAVTHRELVAAFGAPHGRSPDDKSDAQWFIEYADGTTASVYNYKNGPAYLGRRGTPVTDIIEWNVAGFEDRALDLVKATLKICE